MVIPTDNEKERIRLVELDYDKTNEFIKGVVGTGAALRGLAITVWLALVGFAFQQNLPALALLAAVVIVLFLLVDGYHGWLYAEAAKHVRAVEKVTSTYYNALSRGDDDEDTVRDFQEELRVHRTGLFWTLPHAVKPVALLREARPRVVYRLVYPLLFVLALVAAIAIGPLGAGKEQQRASAATENPSVAAISALTPSERAALGKLGASLRQSQNAKNRQLGGLIHGLLAGAPGAVSAIEQWSTGTTSKAEKAIGAVLGALSRAGGGRATFRTAVKVQPPQISLGGLHVVLRAGSSSPETQTCARKRDCSSAHDAEDEDASARGDADNADEGP